MLSTTGKDTYLSVEEVIMRAREVYNGGVTELHIVGSPSLRAECGALRGYVWNKKRDARCRIKALTATEVYYYAKKRK